MSTTGRLGVLCAAAVLVLTGCTGGSGAPDLPAVEQPRAPTTSASPSYQRYVALGDSYTAGPYVPNTDLANGCLRSSGNYPSLVAAALDVDTFVDVSCSGADTRDLLRPQHTFRDASVPPQLDAVTAATDLVTLGIGGNDFDLFGTLLQTCTRLRDLDPAGAPCTAQLDAQGTDLDRQTARIGHRVATAINEVQTRAPRATVLLVGYPRLTPATGTCPKLLPLARGDYRLAEHVAASLSTSMSHAAEQVGAGFIDVYAASAGHDICAAEPWVNGRLTDQEAALAFHPFSTQMQAVADLVVARVR
ncbi:MAG TPA: SGNH/GDSL hydrolase family protein [Nocardioidaceae bacterium]|nr:SGNH/GDSL hydrolase family protein [Nocardioidaceae bacterium]